MTQSEITTAEKLSKLYWSISTSALITFFVQLTFLGSVFVLFLNALGLSKSQIGFLLRTYGQRPLQPRREPVHELISTMLSDRTTPQNEEIAFEHLWMRFGSWAAIRAAPLTTLAESIALVTFPETKAANIKKTLAHIIDLRGEASLDFLQELPTAGGLAWLLERPGVGLKTASLVLLFCFNKPLLPVDTHVHRVSQRLGLIGPKVTTDAAHRLLLELLPPEPHILFNFHVNMVRHGQRICKWDTPLCPRCPLQGLCHWYATH